jgi:complexin-1/2
MEFMAKQMLSSKMGEVKNLTGGGEGEKKEGEEASAETDPEIIKAREEAEQARKEKHRKMEEQREGMRQGIRDKVR